MMRNNLLSTSIFILLDFSNVNLFSFCSNEAVRDKSKISKIIFSAFAYIPKRFLFPIFEDNK